MALLGWLGYSLADTPGRPHTTYARLPKCPAKKIGPLSGFVFSHTPNAPPWGYSKPPRKSFPDGFLGPTTGLLFHRFECHDTLDISDP